MERKRNNPTWCCDQIEEKIKDYKISLTEIEDEEVKRQLEIVIDDLETILFGQIGRGDIDGKVEIIYSYKSQFGQNI